MDSKLRLLEQYFGGWWCGIKFGKTTDEDSRRPGVPMKFCEAVASSRTGPIRLEPKNMECAGGSRCLGWNQEEETIARMMSEKAGLDLEVSRSILRNTPHLEEDLREVTIGTGKDPDIAISFSQPETVMNLLRKWQTLHGGVPVHAEISGFMSVCGAVAVKTYLTGRICLSFGCLDAREYGSIGRDRLVVGLPKKEIDALVQRTKGENKS